MGLMIYQLTIIYYPWKIIEQLTNETIIDNGINYLSSLNNYLSIFISYLVKYV